MYVGDITPASSQAVANIGGKSNLPSGIVTVKWSWKDDDRKMHRHLVRNALFFPQSPLLPTNKMMMMAPAFTHSVGSLFFIGTASKFNAR